MQIETLLSARVDDKLEFFPEFRVSLAEDGVQITARSPIFAELVSKLPLRQDDGYLHRAWKGNTLRSLTKSHKVGKYMHPEFGGFFPSREDGLTGPRGQANLLWLTHPDLAKGCKVLLKEPIALNDLEDYFTSCCSAIREIYMYHVRSAEFRAKLSEVFER